MADLAEVVKALRLIEEFIDAYRQEQGVEPKPKPEEPKPEEPAGPTMAKIIDDYFRLKNYYPNVPYVPLGDLIVDICHNHTGNQDPLWVSTMATAAEVEGGGKNVLGCDRGSIDCNQPVTKEKVDRLIKHFRATGVSNGVGPLQITFFPFIERAQAMGGAHILRNSMTVGAQYLNDCINQHGYLNGLEMYNDGRPAQDPNNPYEVKFARTHVAWRERLRKAVGYSEQGKAVSKPDPKPSRPAEEWDPVNGRLAPPGFVPARPRQGNYTAQHPTRFIWRPDVVDIIRDLYREFGKNRIFLCTYMHHPPVAPRPNVSFDVWGGGGDRPGRRGLWLPADVGANVWEYLWERHKAGQIKIRWGIYHRKIYGIWNNYQPQPFGNGTVFENHDDHIHITIDGPFEQIR